MPHSLFSRCGFSANVVVSTLAVVLALNLLIFWAKATFDARPPSRKAFPCTIRTKVGSLRSAFSDYDWQKNVTNRALKRLSW